MEPRHNDAAQLIPPPDMALMGGIAVAAWRHFRNTRDIDLLAGVRREDEEKLLRRETY